MKKRHAMMLKALGLLLIAHAIVNIVMNMLFRFLIELMDCSVNTVVSIAATLTTILILILIIVSIAYHDASVEIKELRRALRKPLPDDVIDLDKEDWLDRLNKQSSLSERITDE